MNRHLLRAALFSTIAMAAIAFLAGCSMPRYDRLVSKADKVESSLKSEQRKVLALDAGNPERASRLNHLSSLRTQLSAANVGLSSVRNFVPADKKDIGYDVLEQVYDTIDWNIPLSAGDPKQKQLPGAFSGGVLKLN